MDDIGAVLLFIGAAALLVIVLVLAEKARRKRRLAIAGWASSHGLTFTPERDRRMDERYPFDCLRKGSDRYAENVSAGQVGDWFVRAFDYHYETYSTDSKGRRQTHHHYFSALLIESRLPLKPLSIRSENLFDRVGELLGADDIDFELAEFSREFHVTSPDRRWAYDVLHQESMEFLMASPRFRLDFNEYWLMAQDGTRFQPIDFERALQVTTGLLSRLPQSVLRELEALEAERSGGLES